VEEVKREIVEFNIVFDYFHCFIFAVFTSFYFIKYRDLGTLKEKKDLEMVEFHYFSNFNNCSFENL